MRERVRHSRANLLFFVFERIRSIFFYYASLSLSLSLRARFEREGERLSLFSFISLRGRAIARVVFESERERERWKIFSKRRSPLEKEFGDLVLRAPDKDTERERERPFR